VGVATVSPALSTSRLSQPRKPFTELTSPFRKKRKKKN
jgi:hypothetical protein